MERRTILFMMAIIILMVSCEANFDGSTAIQEVFAKDLYDKDVYLDKGGITLTVVQDTTVPETIEYYMILFYKIGESTTEPAISYRKDYESSDDIEITRDLQRGNYIVAVYGYALKDSNYLAVSSGKSDSFVIEDRKAEQTVTLSDVGHIMEFHEGNNPTCTETGSFSYYQCLRCDNKYSDENGTSKLLDSDIERPALGHSPIYHETKAATCGEVGYHVNNYECQRCGKFFSDSDCTNELDEDEVVIPKTGIHTFTDSEHTSITWITTTNGHYKKCLVCGESLEYATHTIGWTSNDTVHWRSCSACLYEVPDTREAHVFNLHAGSITYCICGRTVEGGNYSTGGFDVYEVVYTPKGHFSGTREVLTENGRRVYKWTFTFVDDNASFPSTVDHWVVWDDEEIADDGSGTLTYTIRTISSCKVACYFKNDYGMANYEKTIYGSDDDF